MAKSRCRPTIAIRCGRANIPACIACCIDRSTREPAKRGDRKRQGCKTADAHFIKMQGKSSGGRVSRYSPSEAGCTRCAGKLPCRRRFLLMSRGVERSDSTSAGKNPRDASVPNVGGASASMRILAAGFELCCSSSRSGTRAAHFGRHNRPR